MTPSEAFRAPWRNRNRKAIISIHRGLWVPAPENSLSACTRAAALGIVEIDIQLAADGVPVIMHDDTLDRMTGLSAAVAATPSEEIARYRLRERGGGPDNDLTDERVPLFADLLAVAPKNSFYDFDVKHPREVEDVAAFITAEGGQHHGSLKIDTATAADIDRLLGL